MQVIAKLHVIRTVRVYHENRTKEVIYFYGACAVPFGGAGGVRKPSAGVDGV